MFKNNVIKGLFWKFMERGGVQAIGFIIQLILARLLTPEDYGITGLITVFITVSAVFIQSGLGSALVQKKAPTEKDYSTVFYINIGVSIVMIVILYFCAPAIANFYHTELLTPVLRVCSLSLLFNAFWEVHVAILQKELLFKKLFYANLIASVLSGIIGIIVAYLGFGIWALVTQQILNSLISTIVIWIAVPWRPKWLFSIQSFKELFGFGSKLLCSGLIDTLYNNIQPLIIGKAYTKSDLGYYNRGLQIPSLLVNNINGSIQGVLFPVFSEYQDDRERLKQLVRRSIVTSCFLVFPMMIGLAAVSKPATIILLTEKWLPSVPFMQIACIIYATWPIQTANLQAINAVGRSDIFLKLEIIKKIIGILILCVTVPLGIYPMLWGTVFSSILGTFINSYPNKKLLHYNYLEQIKDILPYLLLSIVMGLLCFSILLLNLNVWLTLILQIVIGIGFYMLGSRLLKLESYFYIVETIKGLIQSRK